MTAVRRIYTTTYVYPWHVDWVSRTRSFDVREGRMSALRALLGSSGPAILHGAVGFRQAYVDLLAAVVLKRRGGPVLLAEATWEPGSRSLGRVLRADRPLAHDPESPSGRSLSRIAVRGVDSPLTHYGVLSTAELTAFPALWGVDAGRVHFTPFFATASDHAAAPGGAGVFSSGNSLRDYRALITAAPRLLAPVTIASSLRFGPAASANLQIAYFSAAEHEARMRAAAVVVVPLRADSVRSGGHQTYLNAMLQGKPVVVTEAPGVRDHIMDGQTGIIVHNNPLAIERAVNRLLDDPVEARRVGTNARSAVEQRYMPHHYVNRLLELADSL